MTNDDVRLVRAPLLQGQNARPDLSLSDLFELFRRGKRYVVVSLAVAVTMGGVYLFFATPNYNVMAQLLLFERGALSDDTRPMRNAPLFLTTQAKIIESSAVAGAALASLPFEPNGDSKFDVSNLLTSLTVTPIKGTHVLALAYRTSDPEEGAQILRSLIGAYSDFVRGIEAADHAQDLEVLARREEQQRTRLAEIERQFQDSYALSGALGEGAVAELREELWRAESQEAALRGSYGVRHPQVVAMKKQIAALRVEMRKARVVGTQRLEHEQLRDEIQRVRLIHQSTLTRLRDAELTGQGLEGGRAKIAIHVLQAPVPPEEKAWPIPALVLVPCAAIGLVAGLGLSWITHQRHLQGDASGGAALTTLATDAVAVLTTSATDAVSKSPVETGVSPPLLARVARPEEGATNGNA